MKLEKRGGRRPGAGRKPGINMKEVRLQETMKLSAMGEGLLPIAMLIEAMRAAQSKPDLDEHARLCTGVRALITSKVD
jgi:hypothetical protein